MGMNLGPRCFDDNEWLRVQTQGQVPGCGYISEQAAAFFMPTREFCDMMVSIRVQEIHARRAVSYRIAPTKIIVYCQTAVFAFER